jgi:hypothetical protein
MTGFTVVTEWVSPTGRVLTPGRELSIAGERGRFRFVKHVTTPDGRQWVDVVGGPEGHTMTRSFRPDRIRTVHNRAA